ncbi:MAG: DNA mismatch repair protein MutS [Flavobacteriaceae bacterium]|nr:DNA mismatch repair protein MutS [Flavobacteriaceae bacterium]MDG1965139.1 DNA mismatch repair protein MutS [Flavobacteriaceae bacterium]
MKQYNQIKVKYPDALLLFRVGDFYETFGADAVRAAKILGIILTKRGAGSASETELAGFPHHSLNTYLPKLVRAGCRVAICDQLEDPKLTKKIVKRGVTELVTPGVSLNDEVLEQKKNNFLAAVHFGKSKSGISFLDISTGDYWVSEGTNVQVEQLLQNFAPSEVLVAKPLKKFFTEQMGGQFNVFYLEDWIFESSYALEQLTAHFKILGLKGFGIESMDTGVIASGAILHYLKEAHHNQIPHITAIRRIFEEEYVWMDRFTMRNLELFQSTSPNGVALIDVLDHTLTAMGGRMLKHGLAFPERNLKVIEQRLDAVAALVKDTAAYDQIAHHLNQMVDIERIVAKIATQKISPRALVQLGKSLQEIAQIKIYLSKHSNKALKERAAGFLDTKEVTDLIQSTLHAEAPVLLSKGGVIAEGVNSELDELRELLRSGKGHLDKMLERESERTQIPSLKIAFNNVFGYYIEVRNTHKDRVPEDWIRKQTLVNAERYITEELKEYETKILGAEEKIKIIESRLYLELLTELQAHIEPLKVNARQLARLDVLWCFASLAIKHNYTRPEFSDQTVLEVKEGRHPVIEHQLPAGTPFIANDLLLDPHTQQIIMITGPNMSGKSAILRQTALLVLMAQMGSFVPATSLKTGVMDKIFTRVGASDNISIGESTFMVEMNETASILNNITENSLVLLDEIGRGTSTYDGISIAWAIAEFLHEHPAKAKVLFATHYHELNEMTHDFPRIKNFNVSVKELEDKVLFLRKLVPGGSAHSFGIHVAKMAGMPEFVIRRASQKLKVLEKSHTVETNAESLKVGKDEMQLSFFNLDDPLLENLREEIKDLDIDTLTPIEALMKLNEIKRQLKQ